MFAAFRGTPSDRGRGRAGGDLHRLARVRRPHGARPRRATWKPCRPAIRRPGSIPDRAMRRRREYRLSRFWMGFRPRHADARRDARGGDGWSLAVLCLARPRAGLARGLGAYPATVLGDRADPSGHGWVQGEFVRFPGVGAALRRPDAAEGARPSGRSARRFLPAGGPWSRRAWGRALATGRAYVTELRAAEGRSNIAPACRRSRRGRRDTVLGEILAAHMAPCPDLLERLVAEVAIAVSARGAAAFPDDRRGHDLVRSRRALPGRSPARLRRMGNSLSRRWTPASWHQPPSGGSPMAALTRD